MHERSQGERVIVKVPPLFEQAQDVEQYSMQRRSTIRAMCLAFTSLSIVVIVFFYIHSFLEHIETRFTHPPTPTTRMEAMTASMQALRGKFNRILAESVEIRLSALNRLVESGKVTPDDLHTMDTLQRDIELLERYVHGSNVATLDGLEPENQRYRMLPQKPVISDTILLQEVVKLRWLLYGCFAGITTGFIGILGYYWYRSRRVRKYFPRYDDEKEDIRLLSDISSEKP